MPPPPGTVFWIAAVAFCGGCWLGPLLHHLIRCLADDQPLSTALNCDRCGTSVPDHTRWIPLAGLVRSTRCPGCEAAVSRSPALLGLGTGLLFATFAWLYFGLDCQGTPEVRPTLRWYYGRYVYHLVLITLLIVATGTDLRNYTIADALILTGAAAGVGLAGVSGDLQMIHIWVDWNQEIPSMHGPWLPAWLSEHQHLHGVAWSMAGMLTGAGLTWLTRFLADVILGREALGLGDVTLMAMIGSFVGWQPVVTLLALAPMLAIVTAALVRVLTGRTFVAFGPYLALSTLVVLCTWRWIWGSDLRLIFGHWPSLVLLASVALGGLTVLLGALRGYQAIPAKVHDRSDEPRDPSDN